MSGISCGGMPGPLSRTVIDARYQPCRERESRTVVPAGVWVRALASRLASTWCNRGPSPCTITGSSSGTSSSQRWSGPAACASLERVHRQPGQVDLVAVQRPAGIEPGQQQQVLDQRGHPAGLGLHPAHRVRDVRRCDVPAAPGQLGVAADRGQRGAQLVAGVGDELPDPHLAAVPGVQRVGRRWSASGSARRPTWPTSVCGFGLRHPLGQRDLALVQAHLGDPGGGGGDPLQRAQRQPDDGRADQAGDQQRDQRSAR